MSVNFLLQSGDGGVGVTELQAALSEREAEILQLKEELKATTAEQGRTVTQVKLDPKCLFTIL